MERVKHSKSIALTTTVLEVSDTAIYHINHCYKVLCSYTFLRTCYTSIIVGKSEVTQQDDKPKNGKKVAPGVRLYQQAKSKPKTKHGRSRTDEPVKPVLTKAIEEMLINSNREK